MMKHLYLILFPAGLAALLALLVHNLTSTPDPRPASTPPAAAETRQPDTAPQGLPGTVSNGLAAAPEPTRRNKPQVHPDADRPSARTGPENEPAPVVELLAADTPPVRDSAPPPPTAPAPAGKALQTEPAGQDKSLTTENPPRVFLAQGELPVQSPARPRGLEIVAPVEASPYDPQYAQFVSSALPEIDPFLETHFDDRPNIEANSLDIEFEDLILKEDARVRVYFIKEGTVFHNSLGINLKDEAKIIFPDASSTSSYFRDADTRKEYTSEDVPLVPGDYVDLGPIEAGTLLDLFLIKDGARTEDGPVYGLDKEKNHDKHNHVKLHGLYNDHTLIIGFEDLPNGGDRDYNDLVIAVEMTPVDE